MLHLFNKTYLDVDFCIDINEHRIVVSKENGVSMLEVLEKISSGKLYAAGETVDTIVGHDKNYTSMNDLFEFCLNFNKTTNKKMIIYCDQVAYMTIAATWFKTIFFDITADAAYNIIKAYFTKLILFGGRNEWNTTSLFSEFIFGKAEFNSVFNNIVLEENYLGILDKVTGFRSIEYLVSSYLYNKSHKEELKEKLSLMINRNIEGAMEDLWRHYQETALMESFQQARGLQYYNFDNILDMENDPALNSIKITNAWRLHSNSGDNRLGMNMTLLNASQIQQIKDQFVEFSVSNEKIYQRSMTYIDIAHRGYVLDEEIDKILYPQFHPTFQYEWWSRKDVETINIFLLMFFANEIEKNRQTQTLQPYLLR
jgi:hypothetical protein